MQAGNLELVVEFRLRHRDIDRVQKIIEVEKIGEHIGMDQQRGVDLGGIGIPQHAQLVHQFFEQCLGSRRRTDHITYLFLTCTALANGHRFRPMTAFSSQRCVAAMMVSVSVGRSRS